jgi:VWFA-related protein
MIAHRTVVAVLLCVCVLPVAAQQPTFSARREMVRVDVLVTDGGRPVRGLQPSDFDVFDSGVAQRVELVSFEALPVRIVLALDLSASISAQELDHLRDGGRAVLANLKHDDQVALLTFADAVMLRERLTAEAERVGAALGRMEPAADSHGGTALVDACYAAMTVVDQDAGRGLLIVFTDGVDTSSWLPAYRVLQAARRSNLVVYAVSTAPLKKGSFLRDLSDVTGGGAVEIQSTDRVRATFVSVLDEFRQRYLVSYSPTNVAVGGWHPLTVRVKKGKADVKARAGYVRDN